MPDRTFDELPRAVVVLGAGASADAASNGQLIKDNGWRPPVARELFDFKHRAEFHHHLMAYRGAQALAGELASLSARGDLKLEDQLRSYE
ncbi:MAG: hypothetical protein HOH95_14350, partial [Dehalococcoidia bacterium]|nr:hypothetical protein [Dehalococcoidia bacterium]